MATRIIDDGTACFYCDTSMVAFGPVAERAEELEEFEEELELDPRQYPEAELLKLWADFLEAREEEHR